MKLFDLLVILTLCTTVVSSKEATFPGESKVIEHLAKKLTQKQCWVVGNYLAQKSAKPVQAQTKMVKTGGHIKDFDCLAGLKLWASVILPPMLEKVQQKERFAKKQLKQALVFARRKDLRDWLQNYDHTTDSFKVQASPLTKKIAADLMTTTQQPELIEKVTLLQDLLAVAIPSIQAVVPADSVEDGKPAEAPKNEPEDNTLDGNKLDGNKVQGNKPKARQKAPMGKNGRPERSTPSSDSVGKQVIKYVVISVIGVVSLCLTVAIACSCRRRGRHAEDEEDGLDLDEPGASVSGLGDAGVTGQDDKFLDKDYNNGTHRQPGRSIPTIENGDNVNANPIVYRPTTTSKRL